MHHLAVNFQYYLLVILSYFWGSVPYGYIVTKISTGKNILKYGSGNTGSTNVRRVAGSKMSLLTQVLDMFKGILPVALFLILNKFYKNPFPVNFIYFIALSTIIGHNFSIFLKFKGGKGVNTTLGSSLLIAPYSVIIGVLVYYIVKSRFKYVSLGSIIMATSMPLSELLFHGITATFYYLAISCGLIIIMHHSNIRRLIHGEEII